MTAVVGIDVGGTKVAAGLVEPRDGRVLERLEVPTAPERGPAAVLDDCVVLATRLSAGLGPVPVGVGVCELVDLDGRVASGQTVDWRGLDVAGAFAAVGPARVEADVRAAALAEASLGAGQGLRRVLFVVVGTGIACCLVLDGVPYAGAHGNALVVGAPPVEDLASGRALAQRHGVTRAEEVLADPTADGLVAAAAAALGASLAALVNALDPDVVVVGGGLGLVESYRRRVEGAMRALIWAEESARVPLRPAALGRDTGIVGAALSAVPPAGRADA